MIDWNYTIDSESYHLSLVKSNQRAFQWHAVGAGQWQLLCPEHTDFSSLQTWLVKVITEHLRQQAQQILPPKLRQLAEAHQLPLRLIQIRNMRTRWGSCSSRRDIHLSLYLLLLPERLQQFIMLHELAHLREMNHGPRFHALLNQFTGGQEKALNHELKNFHMHSWE